MVYFMGFIIGCIVVFLVFSLKRRYQIGKRWSTATSKAVIIQGEELLCTHCKYNKFEKREGLLNTTVLLGFNLGFLNRSASCYVCDHYKYVHWFLSR